MFEVLHHCIKVIELNSYNWCHVIFNHFNLLHNHMISSSIPLRSTSGDCFFYYNSRLTKSIENRFGRRTVNVRCVGTHVLVCDFAFISHCKHKSPLVKTCPMMGKYYLFTENHVNIANRKGSSHQKSTSNQTSMERGMLKQQWR